MSTRPVYPTALRKAISAQAAVNGYSPLREPAQTSLGGRYWTIRRLWQPGQTATLTLPIPPRVIVPDARIEAVAGTVVFARGPIIYCLKKQDVDFPVETARAAIEPAAAAKVIHAEWREDLLEGVYVLHVPGETAAATAASDPKASPPLVQAVPIRSIELKLVPFYARANRSNDSRWVVFIPNRPTGEQPAPRGDVSPGGPAF